MPASASSPRTASPRPRAGRRCSRESIRLQLSGQVPALRLAAHARSRAVRLDVVQGAVRVPRLPRAVRSLQGDLTRDHLHAPPRALPPARGRRSAPAHRRQRRGHLRGARGAAGRVRLPARPVRRPARERRRARGAPQLLDLPRHRRRARISVGIKRDLGGLLLGLGPREPHSRRPARRDEPGGHVHLQPARSGSTRTSSPSRPAPASPR